MASQAPYFLSTRTDELIMGLGIPGPARKHFPTTTAQHPDGGFSRNRTDMFTDPAPDASICQHPGPFKKEGFTRYPPQFLFHQTGWPCHGPGNAPRRQYTLYGDGDKFTILHIGASHPFILHILNGRLDDHPIPPPFVKNNSKGFD